MPQGRQGHEGRLATARQPRARLGARPTETLHPLARRVDGLSTRAFLALLHREDLRAVRAVGRALPSLTRACEAATASLRQGGRLIYVGAGTSGRLAALDAAECPPTFGVRPDRVIALVAGGPRALRQAVEGAEDDAKAGAGALARLRPTRRDTVVGVTASGDTPFVLGALRAARRQRCTCVVVAGALPPATRRVTDIQVLLETGPEVLQGSTRLKAGTAAKLALNAISTRALAASGHVLLGRMVELRPTSEKLRQRAVRIVAELARLPGRRAAALLRQAGSVKVALVMAARGTDGPGARALLRAARGDLPEVLGKKFLSAAGRG
ncbi:MAG TPA: N-acetylmuramic acid 6-phosphate etherase [Myxococcales bacterium]|nr:N-acetylmuramic acid 6-phosphate etherase [Myxococcales bacterium]